MTLCSMAFHLSDVHQQANVDQMTFDVHSNPVIMWWNSEYSVYQ